MKKKKKQKNYLDLIPEKSAEILWETDGNKKVILSVKNTGVFNRIAQKLFGRPQYTKVHLDKLGSFLWPLIDGEKSVLELAKLQKEAFGDEVEPLYPRIVKYFQIVESYRFIHFKEMDGKGRHL